MRKGRHSGVVPADEGWASGTFSEAGGASSSLITAAKLESTTGSPARATVFLQMVSCSAHPC